MPPSPLGLCGVDCDDVRRGAGGAARSVCVCVGPGPGTWRPPRVWLSLSAYLQSKAEALQLAGPGVGAAAADSPGHLAQAGTLPTACRWKGPRPRGDAAGPRGWQSGGRLRPGSMASPRSDPRKDAGPGRDAVRWCTCPRAESSVPTSEGGGEAEALGPRPCRPLEASWAAGRGRSSAPLGAPARLCPGPQHQQPPVLPTSLQPQRSAHRSPSEGYDWAPASQHRDGAQRGGSQRWAQCTVP